MASLDDLISPETEDESLSYYLTELANVGFPTTAWQTGSVVYTIITILAKKTVEFVTLVALIAKSGLLDLSEGAWLTLLAKHVFRLDRYPATFTRGRIRVTVAPGFGGQTIQPGQLWVKTGSNKRYNSFNASAVTIDTGASEVLDFRAESPGLAYNVSVGTGLQLVTPLPGVHAEFEDLGGSTWITTQGADEEKDAPLRVRCRTKWATLGIEKTIDAYLHLVTDTPGLGTQPNRVYVDASNPRGPGTLDIWLAGPSGPLPSADVLLVRDYVLARKDPCADLQVNAAIPKLVTIAAAVYYDGSFASAPDLAKDAVTTFTQNLPLGATDYRAAVLEQLMAPDGVINVNNLVINGSSTADLTLLPQEVATVNTITITPVVVNV